MDIPPSVLSPFLTEPALMLLGQTVNNEEDQLWRMLGDCWNVPRYFSLNVSLFFLFFLDFEKVSWFCLEDLTPSLGPE